MAEQYNNQAEQIVLGSALIEGPMVLPVVDGILKPSMFYFHRHRVIYQVLQELHEHGQPIDPVIAGNRLEEKGVLHEVGGQSYLSDLMAAVTTTTTVDYYAQIIRKRWFLRELGQIGLEIQDLSQNADNDLPDLLDQAESHLLGLTQQAVADRKDDTASAFDDRFAELEQIRTTGVQPGHSTGFSDLDRYGGFQNEELLILAGRPSMGKTALAVSQAMSMAMEGKHVMVFSAEMTQSQMVDRFIAAHARINLQQLRFGKLPDEEWQRAQRANAALRELPLHIIEATGMDVMTLRGMARRQAMETGVDLVVVDYLTLIDPGREFQRSDLAVGHVANSLQRLAQEIQAPVLCLAQLNRSLEHREDKRPRLSDLRESGDIEQAAHVVWFLYREAYYQNDEDEEERLKPKPTEVIVAKNRNGPTGKVTLTWHPERASFEAYTPF